MKKNNNVEYKNVEKMLKENSKLKIEKLLKKYNTSLDGISVVDVEERIEQYGKNIIDIKDQNTIWHRLKEAFINPFKFAGMGRSLFGRFE